MRGSLVYQVRVRGHLSPVGAAWFEGLSVRPTPNGDTVIAGALPDQSSLHGALARIRDLGLELVSVEVLDPATAQQSDTEV